MVTKGSKRLVSGSPFFTFFIIVLITYLHLLTMIYYKILYLHVFVCFAVKQPFLGSTLAVARDYISRYLRKYLYLVYKVVFQVKVFVVIVQIEKCFLSKMLTDRFYWHRKRNLIKTMDD